MGWFKGWFGRPAWLTAVRQAYEAMGRLPRDYRPTPEEEREIAALFQRASWTLRRWRARR
jgi:hypothetical protein